MLGNSFGNADNQGDLGSDGLFDTGCGNGGTIGCVVSQGSRGLARRDDVLRYEDGGRRSAGLPHSIANIAEDRQAEMCLASLLGVRSADNLGP